MKQFLWFIAGLVALSLVLANLGPMILLGVSVWLLYIIFKKFMKTDSTAKKVLWVVLGLIVLSITVSNLYALIGVAAAYVLYVLYKGWKSKNNDHVVGDSIQKDDDPFINFEKQWAELNKS
ncbi:flagellar basal body rod protein [Pontibacillus yanchengensis]|uniref:Flagellar basal body rod protein n=1 Tax=Pontibacillus yanchengensis TaxID=462910 RepID=A0ACC7VHI4_9BACI|nr:flagellar basal body rod protein [Pontibacillus yanchengensis]MYL53641.1 flagellar basal body rod protein [Pontibacillus yanchengensis]